MRLKELFLTATITTIASSNLANAEENERRQFTFTWPFVETSKMAPRGGTSKGPEVKLSDEPTLAWTKLQEKGLNNFERDRRAILAMQGPYRTSFDFIEVAGFKSGFKPDAPYQSWGTEYIYLVADEGDFISLQHILVMFVMGTDNTLSDPIVVKHWRQDWQYEDREITVFKGFNSWESELLPLAGLKGTWTQAVFQVDDSPRYEAQGKWVHKLNYSQWQSNETWRPLPRREFSIRDDYDALVGTNRHTITPTGWTHQEDNLKVLLETRGVLAEEGVLAQELGFNRYERIIDHDFSEGDIYWRGTRYFWEEVRSAWKVIMGVEGHFSLADTVDGRPLFSEMFRQAEAFRKTERPDLADVRRTIGETLNQFVTRN